MKMLPLIMFRNASWIPSLRWRRGWKLQGLLAVLLLSRPAYAQITPVDRLKADLLGGESATQVLTRWCAARALAPSPVIHAIQDVKAGHELPPDARRLLSAKSDEPIAHRRVRLTCGDHVLSEADNWYLPSRLDPEMNKTLEETDSSFGTVVKPLNFHRRTLEVLPQSSGSTVLRVRALLLTPDDRPFSLVVENYTSDLTGTAR